MSLLEDWDIQDSAISHSYDLQSPDGGSRDLVEDSQGPKAAEQQPIFSVEVAERNIAR